MEEKRIYIAGPSGTGKSTLAKHIAHYYGIPFISTSGKMLWDKFGIKDHQDLIKRTNLDPDGFGYVYQVELLKQREAALAGHAEFVTDRSPIDNLVYFLAQVSSYCSMQKTEEYIELCENSMKMGNKVIYIPFTHDVVLENDGARITNPYYQLYITSTFNFVIRKNLLKFCRGGNCLLTLDKWDFNTRIKQVDNFLKIKSCEEKNDSNSILGHPLS